MKKIKKTSDDDFLYLQITESITRQIQQFTLKTGDKLSSLRAFSKERGISLSTAYKAYAQLEMNGLIEARPKSGYYVRYTPIKVLRFSRKTEAPNDTIKVNNDEMLAIFLHNFSMEGMVKLSLATPDISLIPQAKLNKSMLEAIRSSDHSCINYEDIQGNLELRKHIARQAISWSNSISANEIITTQGCTEALILCLRAITKPGDTVAIESPTYFGIFNAVLSLGLKVLEIPADPSTGIDLDYLSGELEKQCIKACLFVPTFSNPLGFCMSNESKKQLVALLLRHEIPLIEDDVYGEMYFGKARPKTCKSYDRHGMVLLCSSVSKSLAPGYRVGWCMPGKYMSQIMRLKLISTISSATPSQAAIANFFETGRFDLHMRNLRRALYNQCLRYTRAISEYFPPETKISQPAGGYFLWIELPKNIDSLDVFHIAAEQHISVAPGYLFDIDHRYSNYIRISFGNLYNSVIESSLILLGQIIGKLAITNAAKMG
jgi:DNA-binding transcriptional MocR family regulator